MRKQRKRRLVYIDTSRIFHRRINENTSQPHRSQDVIGNRRFLIRPIAYFVFVFIRLMTVSTLVIKQIAASQI